ncbi:hypothetical protein KOW79_001253 [Hemibagrus wyckioides]|uniref:Uncharacterized protein n=1 Tax=Hemibagrus wyckioides TaxID=337641 RepID=A0A9D3SS63_9TELE|nr:hypothetical protein KOW79_001253 [Hemibagrus wyckioides]
MEVLEKRKLSEWEGHKAGSADSVNQGNYFCIYDTTVSSHTFTSTTASQVIIAKESLPHYIGIGVTAGLLLIFIPVIICFVKRQKDHMDKEEDTQHAKTTYKSFQEEDTENKATNKNTKTIFQQKNDAYNSDIDCDE